MNIRQLAEWLDGHGISYKFRGLHSLEVLDCFDANPTVDLKWDFCALLFQEQIKGNKYYKNDSVKVVLLTDTSFNIDNRLTLSKFVSMVQENEGYFKLKLPEYYTLEGSDEFIFEQLENYFKQIKTFHVWLGKALKYLKIKEICKDEIE